MVPIVLAPSPTEQPSPVKALQSNQLQEVGEFIERESLYGLGCGLIDLQLLASVLITPGTKLWTQDKHLAKLTERFHIAYTTSPIAN